MGNKYRARLMEDKLMACFTPETNMEASHLGGTADHNRGQSVPGCQSEAKVSNRHAPAKGSWRPFQCKVLDMTDNHAFLVRERRSTMLL